MTSTNDSDITFAINSKLPTVIPATEIARLISSADVDKFFEYLANLPSDNQSKENIDVANVIVSILENQNNQIDSNKLLEWLTSSLEQFNSASTLIPSLAKFFLFTLDQRLQQPSFIQQARQKILTTLQALLAHRIAADPDDLDTAWHLSVADNKLGDFYLFRKQPGDMERALASYSAGLKIRERLFQAHRKQAKPARDLSVSYEKLGDFYLQRNNPNDAESALDAYTTSLEIDKKLYRANSKNTQAARDLSITQNKFGDLNLQIGKKTNIKTALTAYKSSKKIRQRLQRYDRKNIQLTRDLLLSYHKLGDLYLQRYRGWDKWRALKAYQTGLSLASNLYADNQNDPNVAQDFAYFHNKLGNFYLRRNNPGDIQRALASYTTCSEILERLHSDNPKNFVAARNLAVIYNKLGDVYLQRNESEDVQHAVANFQAALELSTQLHQIDPNFPDVARDLSVINNKLGDVYLRSDTAEDKERALSAYTTGMELREQLHKIYPHDVQTAKDLAVSYWKMALGSQNSPTKMQLWWDNCYRQFLDIAQQNNLSAHEQKYLQYAAQKASYTLDKPKPKLLEKKLSETKSPSDIYPLRTAKRIVMAFLIIFWISSIGGLIWIKDPKLLEVIGNRVYQTTATTFIPMWQQINRNLQIQPALDQALKVSQNTWNAISTVQIPESVKNFTFNWNFQIILNNVKITAQHLWASISAIQIPNTTQIFTALDFRPSLYKFSQDMWKMLPPIQQVRNFFHIYIWQILPTMQQVKNFFHIYIWQMLPTMQQVKNFFHIYIWQMLPTMQQVKNFVPPFIWQMLPTWNRKPVPNKKLPPRPPLPLQQIKPIPLKPGQKIPPRPLPPQRIKPGQAPFNLKPPTLQKPIPKESLSTPN
jgi:hypothetical protein